MNLSIFEIYQIISQSDNITDCEIIIPTMIATKLFKRIEDKSENEPISDRLRVWLDGAPIDILILRLRAHSATNFSIGHADIDNDYAA